MTYDLKTSTELIEVLRDILDRPIAFHRVFVRLTGSVTAALMLSQAMYWSKRTGESAEGWFFKTAAQWEEETGLSRFEQEGARKILRRSSFWKEHLRGVPAKMHYRVDVRALSNELAGGAESGKAFKDARLLKTSNQACGKTSSKLAGFQQTSLLETGQHYKGVSETTSETIKTTPLTPLEPACGPLSRDPGGGRGFIGQALSGTLLAAADPVRIARAAKKYSRTSDEIAVYVDVLDQQYRRSQRAIEDPTALVVTALKEGVSVPEGYMSRAQQEAELTSRREAASKKSEEAQEAERAAKAAYEEAEAIFSSLGDAQREELFDQAKVALHGSVRSSKTAIRSMALNIIAARAREKDGP